jgi:hypothetical protein
MAKGKSDREKQIEKLAQAGNPKGKQKPPTDKGALGNNANLDGKRGKRPKRDIKIDNDPRST